MGNQRPKLTRVLDDAYDESNWPWTAVKDHLDSPVGHWMTAHKDTILPQVLMLHGPPPERFDIQKFADGGWIMMQSAESADYIGDVKSTIYCKIPSKVVKSQHRANQCHGVPLRHTLTTIEVVWYAWTTTEVDDEL